MIVMSATGRAARTTIRAKATSSAALRGISLRIVKPVPATLEGGA